MATSYDADVRSVGVRAGGEKRHEALINDDEMVRAIAQKNVVVIPPAVHSWTADAWKTDGTIAVPHPYHSNAVKCCTYTVEELAEIITGL